MGRTTGPPALTTPTRALGTRMKTKNNNNRRKITRMTEQEKDEVQKTTKDIRKFFEGRTNSNKTTSYVEVSPNTTNSNNIMLSLLGKLRPVVRRDVRSNSEARTDAETDDGTKSGTVAVLDHAACGGDRVHHRRHAADTLCGGDRADEGGDRPPSNRDKLDTVLNAGTRSYFDADVSVRRGRVSGCQYDDVIVDPGTHQDSRGGGEVHVGRDEVPGDGHEGGNTFASLRTKPKEVGGGLKAMVHLWEIKSGGGLPDEKLERKTMRSTAYMKPERVFNTDRKWNTATIGKAWPGKKQS